MKITKRIVFLLLLCLVPCMVLSSGASDVSRQKIRIASLLGHHQNVPPQPSVTSNHTTGFALVMSASAAATETGFLATFLAANPIVAPVTIGVGGVGLVSYGIWSLISGIKKSKNAAKQDTGQYISSPMPPEDPKKRRNDDEFHNMYEVFKRAPIGEKLKSVCEPTRFHFKGAKIFKVIKDVKEYGIKAGDWLYLDTLHGDHIEVFRKCGTIMRTVLNMDGTQNLIKLANAGVRSIEQCIR